MSMSNRAAALAAFVVILLTVALPHAGAASRPAPEAVATVDAATSAVAPVSGSEPGPLVVEAGAAVLAAPAIVSVESHTQRPVAVPPIALAFPVLAGVGLAVHLLARMLHRHPHAGAAQPVAAC